MDLYALGETTIQGVGGTEQGCVYSRKYDMYIFINIIILCVHGYPMRPWNWDTVVPHFLRQHGELHLQSDWKCC